MVTTRKYNRIVWVVVGTYTLNEMGGSTFVETDRWKKWASIQDRSGSNSNQYQQQVWEYDYKIMMRFERSRPTKSNYMIEYENYRLKIESLSLDSEGYKDEEVCRCSKVDEIVMVPVDPLLPAAWVTEIVTLGDSMTVPYNVPEEQGYAYLLSQRYGLTLSNQAVSATHWLTAVWNYYNTYNSSIGNSIVTIMVGFNLACFIEAETPVDMPKYMAAAQASLRSILAAAYSKARVPANSLPSTGSWGISPGDAYPEQFSSFARLALSGLGRYTATPGSSITFTSAASTSIVIGISRTFGTNGVYQVEIDGVVVSTESTNGIANVNEFAGHGFGYTFISDALIFKDLSNTSHAVVITFVSGDGLNVDWFGTLKAADATDNTPFVIATIPDLIASKWDYYYTSKEKFQQFDAATAEVVDIFAGFPIRITDVNRYWKPDDIPAQIQVDEVHPTALGELTFDTSFAETIDYKVL